MEANSDTMQLLLTMTISGLVGALVYIALKRKDGVKHPISFAKTTAGRTSSTTNEDGEEVLNTDVLEKTHRMKGFAVVPTPKSPGGNPEKKIEKIKGSLAYVSAVANALGDMVRDKNADAFMDMAVEEASIGVVTREGGPFGAVVMMTDEDGEERVISRAHNMVLQNNDPTAHAEVTAIRKACARLGTFDLSECTLYTSCYPCPMCYGAIHWAKIKKCVYAAQPDDAAKAGFDDMFIYEAIRGTASEEHCAFVRQPHEGAVAVFQQTFDPY